MLLVDVLRMSRKTFSNKCAGFEDAIRRAALRRQAATLHAHDKQNIYPERMF
jgi:hypothetical protein